MEQKLQKTPRLLQNMFSIETYFELIISNPELTKFITDLILKRDISSWTLQDIKIIYNFIDKAEPIILQIKSILKDNIYSIANMIPQLKLIPSVTKNNSSIFATIIVKEIASIFWDKVKEIGGPISIRELFQDFKGGEFYEIIIIFSLNKENNRYCISSASLFSSIFSLCWNTSTYNVPFPINGPDDIIKILYAEISLRAEYSKITSIKLIHNIFTNNLVNSRTPIIKKIIEY